MTDEDFWRLEERLWLEGDDAFAELIYAQCVMAFAPMGVMQGSAILNSIRQAPRWREVAMEERTIGRPDADTIVLGYRAVARRETGDEAYGDEAYTAYCTSTWCLIGPDWKLVQHQQTPAG